MWRRVLHGVPARADRETTKERAAIVCPTCNAECAVPDGNVEKLPVVRLLKRLAEAASAQESEATQRDILADKCATHRENNADLYCTDCELTACVRCTDAGNAHDNHRVVSLANGRSRVATHYERILEDAQKVAASCQGAGIHKSSAMRRAADRCRNKRSHRRHDR